MQRIERLCAFVLMYIENMGAWERYESKRNDLADKLAAADRELEDIKKVSTARLP